MDFTPLLFCNALLPRPTGELSAQLTEGVFVHGCAMLEANTPSDATRHLPRWTGEEKETIQ
jgi:hypothetical protein